MTDRPDIEGGELISVRAMDGGRGLRLRLRDRNGRPRTITLPSDWLGAMLAALPWPSEGDEVHAVASWSIDRGNGEDLLLTLRTPRGQAMTFALKPWQVAGMATIATYGGAAPVPRKSLH
ncbi:hypothetical protein [Rhodopila sp.]|jgi:hypothetical protein|uniref:hypothetical protein n=1 Tax=Rhodopila sp. TaxID=2480087 RepID=UPI002BCAF3D3|nr:hypothetical protein [Rhodopila sp.]HVZ08863.1 hypothetical protein [Rhodopila sp.]